MKYIPNDDLHTTCPQCKGTSITIEVTRAVDRIIAMEDESIADETDDHGSRDYSDNIIAVHGYTCEDCEHAWKHGS